MVEFDTGPETRMSLNLEFLMLALNLLSMVDFRLWLEVLIGVLLECVSFITFFGLCKTMVRG